MVNMSEWRQLFGGCFGWRCHNWKARFGFLDFPNIP